jgi:transaldolase/glucose-6-phosphate isomerase
MSKNRLKALGRCHQSVWLDFIRRNLFERSGLAKLVEEDGITGVTSNPSIFKNAIAASTDYNEMMLSLFKNADLSIKSIYEQCAIQDIQAAADILRPIYDKTKKADGYVSMEVPPELARDTQGTILEAKRIWHAVSRPNLLVKVPGTKEGALAIRELIAEGININVTLLFSVDMYQNVANAYMEGLERRVQANLPIDHIASVASFFVSRLDVLIDKQIDDAANKTAELLALKGKISIAYAKTAYQQFKAMKETPRYKALAAQGAQPQRLLWASTSTKDPLYSDVMYVESLIGAETVNTIPPQTMNAFRDHGKPASGTLEKGLVEAYMDLQTLERYDISLEKATKNLLEEGIILFEQAFQDLLNAVVEKKKAYEADRDTSALSPMFAIKFSAPENKEAIVQEMNSWETQQKISALWTGDSALWTHTDENHWMGWLHVAEDEQAQVPRINALANELQGEGIKHIVVLGMGGSSLCPAMLASTFPHILGYPELHVLDSTDPLQIKHIEERLDLSKSVFIVSSKSGSTLEPNILEQYFNKRLQTVLGREDVGNRFIVITDPSSKLSALAEAKHFRATFYGLPSIGGRYSALSNFGMVPGGLMGINLIDFLQHAKAMMQACTNTKVADNPGVILGIILGVCANHGKNKVTLIASPGIIALGAWLEQLLAESTGKVGKGLIPVDNEPLAVPGSYGNDRVFAYIRLDSAPDNAQDEAINTLEQAGHVVVRLHLADKSRLAEQLFQWEIATAVAGSVIHINAFNQPDVESAKLRALQLAHAFDKDGIKPQEIPLCSEHGLTIFAPSTLALVKSYTVHDCLKSLLSGVQAGDYVGLAAFIEMSDEHQDLLQSIRTLIRDDKKVATCLGFGPRFLHSTGQAYKGGANTGVFMQLTADHDDDLAVPDHRFTFGFVINAQATSDYEELVKRGRRVVRIHLGKDVKTGLQTLKSIIHNILVGA